jgi:hypothetical protein
MRLKLEQQKRKLNSIFELSESIEDEEIKAYFAKLLCILTSGLLENAVRNLIDEMTSGTSPKGIQNFISTQTKYVTNLRYEKLYAFLNQFDPKWGKQLDEHTTDKMKSALNSLVSNRNNIAHGGNDSISYLIMKDYYSDILEVISILEDIIKK